ncbi:MAG: large repetitive protein [Solirubrobacteraceae bacterium]|jgi:hypothetical protein|nr:large repetitive protein [Solirubrobacteraceae bacterium]
MHHMDVTRLRPGSHALAAALIAGLLLTVTCASAGAVAVKPLKIRPEALKLATVTEPYSRTLSVSGGTAPYTFTLESGALPEGLSLSPAGEITGTPAAVGTSSFSVLATDSSTPARTATITYTLPVQLDIAPRSLPRAHANTSYRAILSATGGTGPYNFTLVSGTLPEVLELFSEPGSSVLTGTPFRAGSYTFTIQASDTASTATGTRTYKLNVGLGMSPDTGRLTPEAFAGQPYDEAICASGGSGPYVYEVSEGSLAEGLSLEPATSEETCAKITGTPTKGEKAKFTVTATDTGSGLTRTVRLYTLVWGISFPTGALVLEETPHEGPPREAENIFLTNKHEANGVISGTIFGANFDAGKWSYNTLTHGIRLKWPETTGPEGTPGADLLYTGTCDAVTEHCTGENALGSFTLKRF